MNKLFSYILIGAVIAAGMVSITFGDDLNVPDYRGDPLSVYAHWENIDGTGNLTLTGFSTTDDSDASTILSSFPPMDYVVREASSYEFALPNWIDEMPIKFMRLQLTWIGDATEPKEIPISGVEGTFSVPGNIVYTSPVQPTPVGFYQYYDIEFKPNPDFERWLVILPDNNFLTQAVADTISTVPEPATLALFGLGGLLVTRRR